MSEEWKDFPGFENKYQISSLGRVKRKETFLPKEQIIVN